MKVVGFGRLFTQAFESLKFDASSEILSIKDDVLVIFVAHRVFDEMSSLGFCVKIELNALICVQQRTINHFINVRFKKLCSFYFSSLNLGYCSSYFLLSKSMFIYRSSVFIHY